MLSSRCNFTIKWVHFINVLWYKEARSLKDFSQKISKTIIFEFSNSNAKQKQTGNWNYGYDLHLTVFLLSWIQSKVKLPTGECRNYFDIYFERQRTQHRRERIVWMISVIWQKLELWEIFTKQWRRRTMESLMIKFHDFYPLHLVVLMKHKHLSLVTT